MNAREAIAAQMRCVACKSRHEEEQCEEAVQHRFREALRKDIWSSIYYGICESEGKAIPSTVASAALDRISGDAKK